jgi:transcriptional regulator with XRE-family HTH domain
MARTKFTSIAEMVRNVSEEQSFADDFEGRMRERQVVKALLMLRAAKGLNQQDIAERLNCTQSRISKLESSSDGDIRLADLCGYASALGLSVEIILMKKEATLVNRVKFHAGFIKRLMDRLAHIAKDDKNISDGALKFFNVAAYNLLKIVQDAAKLVQDEAKAAPGQVSDKAPAFAVQVCEDDCKDREECCETVLVH